MSRCKIQDPSGVKMSSVVTPMLDMTFQLLFFFIMNFNPTDLEGQIHLALPSGPGCHPTAKHPPAQPPKNPAEQPEVPNDLTIRVQARIGEDPPNSGEISTILVRGTEGKEIAIAGGLAGLTRVLRDKKAELSEGAAVSLEADAALKTRHAIKVLDACKAAGLTNVRFLTSQNRSR
jgi:biopolymer transport protein ExbD